VKGILADNNVTGQIAYLVQRMQTGIWEDFWKHLGLVLRRFEDAGLAPDASDVEVWRRCQEEELILITDNRNDDRPDSLAAAIRDFNTASSLPVFTVGDLDKFRTSRDYEERVLDTFYRYLLDIDKVRGSGRLYLP
jgi:hypothetical protein